MDHQQLGSLEKISITECDGRRLGTSIIATNHIPSFDKSPYDGFAFRATDTYNATKHNPVEFEVIDHIGAGDIPNKQLKKNEAIRIMTGAEIPDGANCVAMFEVCHTYIRNDREYVQITRPLKNGENIIKEGSEVKKGEVLVKKGTVINPGVQALLATFGYQQVKVTKKPVVGLFATGTELLEVHEPLERGKIRNSNAYMIAAQINRAGGECIYYGQLPDNVELSYNKIKKILRDVDLFVTTGGVSVGDFDFMPVIYERLHAHVLFNKVAMRPGSVTTVAMKDGKLLFGLSGNPSACYVGFELFVRPIIHSFLHSPTPYLTRIKAIMREDFIKNNPVTRFVRSYLTYEKEKVFVVPAGMDKSNVVSSLAHTDCFMILPAGTSNLLAGETVDVLLLENKEGQLSFD